MTTTQPKTKEDIDKEKNNNNIIISVFSGFIFFYLFYL